MADLQVTCVVRSGGTESTITHLGGAGWKWTKQQVVDAIRQRTHTFYTFEGGKRANLQVVDASPPYVQTVADGRWTNNLLALPSCP